MTLNFHKAQLLPGSTNEMHPTVEESKDPTSLFYSKVNAAYSEMCWPGIVRRHEHLKKSLLKRQNLKIWLRGIILRVSE
jgi:hypothetical protein